MTRLNGLTITEGIADEIPMRGLELDRVGEALICTAAWMLFGVRSLRFVVWNVAGFSPLRSFGQERLFDSYTRSRACFTVPLLKPRVPLHIR